MIFRFFGTFQYSGKKKSDGDLVQHLLEKISSRSWIRNGAIWCDPNTLFDEINDSVGKSKRGELVKGSNPPLVHSAHIVTTCGGRRQGFC